ncbi:capsule biosynthesis protein CapK [Aquabacterium sp. A7-Y]|uniref:AMP-binding protein n=1 Tax=Aquabacterium sp. A7-Y TaxID=1349605 RepID=UPI00223D04D5|nr:AMP-binding protein [Aquabacterium sp. A7-Y]MCW7537539.1 capsule biosynthesis protein CapK [Aquabacterium sp. A7-Y]
MKPAAASLSPEVQRELYDPRRFPVLSAHGRHMLAWLRGHPNAPLYRNYSGHRLDRRALWRARWRSWQVRRGSVRFGPRGEPAEWVHEAVRRHWQALPHWRRRGPCPGRLEEVDPVSRADLSARLEDFVPTALPLQQLICFSTSGTTGHPLRVPSHPLVAAEYLAYHRRALAHAGLRLEAGRGRVGIVLAGYQQRCFTYVSVNPLQGECGLAKLNLHPGEWCHENDRAAYLDALAPELMSGDPVSLTELMRLPLGHRPRALLSTSMALARPLREALVARFGCPVLDLYSMNEVGPIGVFDAALDGHLLLQPGLHVEILDAAGRNLPPGQHGEIVVTGGFNPWLPLLRYRTGDHASLERTPRGWVLRDLQGRAPVRFRAADGRWLNNIEVTHALKDLALTRYALHQRRDASLRLRVDSPAPRDRLEASLRARLQALFGPELALDIEALNADDKVRQYTSELS